MTNEKNLALVFKAIPDGIPVPGEHLEVEDIGFDGSSSAAAPEGGIVVEILYASLDPYLRPRMRDPAIQSYISAFEPGKPMTTVCLARVLKSSPPAEFKTGDIVRGMLPIAQHASLTADQLAATGLRKLDVEKGPADIRHWLGALGGPGLTAYSSLYEIGGPKKGETIFISSAAGAVGQIVGQLAKHAGLRVVGSAGSDDKVRLVTEELGFDAAWNYRTTSTAEGLARHAPDGLDIYYDNVGGEQLETAISRMKPHGRIIACGQVSQYSLPPDRRYGVKNLVEVVMKRLTMRGFLVMDDDMLKWAPEHQKMVTRWLIDGSFKAVTAETVGIDKAAEAFLGMLKGENFGKAVLKIKVDE